VCNSKVVEKYKVPLNIIGALQDAYDMLPSQTDKLEGS